MGFFDKKTKNSTVNNDYAYDQSTHITDQSYNDVDNSIYSNYETQFSDNSDNSLNVDMTDDSESYYSDSSSRNLTDYSDNSLKVDMQDNTGSTNSGNSSSSYSTSSNKTTTTNITDGGAFSVVGSLIARAFDSQNKMIDMVGLNQSKTLAASNDLASRSLDASMAIKKSEIDGETSTSVASMASGALKVVAVAGAVYAATKIWGKR